MTNVGLCEGAPRVARSDFFPGQHPMPGEDSWLIGWFGAVGRGWSTEASLPLIPPIPIVMAGPDPATRAMACVQRRGSTGVEWVAGSRPAMTVGRGWRRATPPMSPPTDRAGFPNPSPIFFHTVLPHVR